MGFIFPPPFPAFIIKNYDKNSHVLLSILPINSSYFVDYNYVDIGYYWNIDIFFLFFPVPTKHLKENRMFFLKYFLVLSNTGKKTWHEFYFPIYMENIRELISLLWTKRGLKEAYRRTSLIFLFSLWPVKAER